MRAENGGARASTLARTDTQYDPTGFALDSGSFAPKLDRFVPGNDW